MSRYQELRKRTMRWQVGWQKFTMRIRRICNNSIRWVTKNFSLKRMGYFFAGALVIAMTWGFSAQRDRIYQHLQIPIKNEGGSHTSIGAEVSAISRLEKEVSALKERLRQYTDTEKAMSSFSPAQFSRPALGTAGQAMGWFRVGDEWQFHDGIDLAVPAGTNVMAAADGVIKSVVSRSTLGTVVTIEHGNGWESQYGHLEGIMVNPGQKVKRGTILGQSAEENCQNIPGFHFSIYLDGQSMEPAGVFPGIGR
ncbi:MAG TPA: M23 family metallopeptidase [Bacillota bacterium]|nr:M23 family metallopeptidase [Bacillota bacterium]